MTSLSVRERTNERKKELFLCSSYKATNLMRKTQSNPSLPKVTPPNSVTLDVRTLEYALWGDTNIPFLKMDNLLEMFY